VVYDPKSPSTAYVDTLMGVWGFPLVLFFAQIITGITSLFKPRRRKWSFS